METFLADSGVEYLLNEAGVLAEGSVTGFMKEKFYNRCTRIHQILDASHGTRAVLYVHEME